MAPSPPCILPHCICCRASKQVGSLPLFSLSFFRKCVWGQLSTLVKVLGPATSTERLGWLFELEIRGEGA